MTWVEAPGAREEGVMPLYEVTDAGLKRQPIAAFAALGMYERTDLQRLLRDDISALGDDLLVIAEELVSGRTHGGASTSLRSTRSGVWSSSSSSAPTTAGTWNSKRSATPPWSRRWAS